MRLFTAPAAFGLSVALVAAFASAPLHAQPAPGPDAGLTTQGPLPSLDVASYMGTWHQVMHLPNRFQRDCIADTTAHYALQPDGHIEVTNRCRTRQGEDVAVGQARPRDPARVVDGRLTPASLEVAFAPRWTRWLPFVWGRYDVVALLDGSRIAIVTEPSREYLWVLARDRELTAEQQTRVEQMLRNLGFDLNAVVRDAAVRDPASR